MNRRNGIEVLILVFLYLGAHFAQHHSLGPWFIRFYLKDILLIPILLYAIRSVSYIFSFNLVIGMKEIIMAFIYVSLAFEIILPYSSPSYSGDWIDVVFYAFGAFYYFIRNRQYAIHISV